MNISEIIQELNRRIKERYSDFKGLYLYGSRVRGDFNKDSDIDVVAVFGSLDREKDFELSGIVADLMYKYGVCIDLHSYTPDSLEKNPFYYDEVVNKGMYYEAA
jgi:predicted nucleotidyltransferase